MNGDIKKVEACKVKPFQLVDRGSIRNITEDPVSKKVMLEDSLKEVENSLDSEDHEGYSEEEKYLQTQKLFLFFTCPRI